MSEQRPRILAIDDAPVNLVTLGAALAAEFDLQTATSGPMGLALAMESPPDLILLDVMMPEMDGYETCRRIMAEPRLRRIPVVFVTALTDVGAESAGLALGAADYITKPINIEIARHRIRNILEREQLRKEVEVQRDLLQAQIAKLAESEAHLRAIIENEPECIKIIDAQGRLVQMNPAGLAMIEADSLEQVAGAPVIDIIAPEYRIAYADLHTRVLAGETGKMQYEVLGFKGGRRWLETHAVPMQYQGARVHLAVTRDITERKQAEDALKKSEQRLREAQRIAQLGSWELDLATNALTGSDEAFRIFEIDPKKFGASYETFLAATHPEDRERVNQAYMESLKNRRPYEITHRLLLPDGTIKYVQEHGETSYASDGKPLRSIGTVQDVTMRILTEESIKESEERYRTIADYTYDWEYWQGPQGEFLYIAPACQRITGYSQTDFISNPGLIYDIIHPEDRSVMDSHLADIHHEDEGSLDFRIVRKDGGIRWIAHGCRAVYAKDGRFLGRRASNRDITDRKNIEEQVQHLAYFDTLTGLPNRRMLFDRLSRDLSQAKRFGRSLAIMFLDLDNFKAINDTLGHDAGDELLKEVATRLKTCVRGGDTVSRQGGDEFVIVLAEIAEQKDAALVAEKIVAVLGDPVRVARQALQVTTSIGIAVYPVNGTDDVRELLKKADQAMYAAKAAGRNGYRFFTD